MLKEFKHIVESDIPDIKQRNVFLAISGGLDSTVLCQLLHESGIKFTLLHCNFCLRDKESDSDQLFVEKLADKLNLPLKVEKFDTRKESKNSKTNIQLTARNLRYKWFNKITKNIETPLILTAHHSDDNVETLLLNLLRGTSLKGAAGIPKLRDNFYRPLLSFKKSEILSYANSSNLEFRTDSSNNEVKYKRNLIRNEIIPQLQAINPAFNQNITAFINDMVIINRNLDEFASDFKTSNFKLDKNYSSVSISKLNDINDILLCKIFEFQKLNRAKMNEFRKFLTSSTGSIFNTDNTEFLKNRKSILFRDNSPKTKIEFIVCQSLPFTFTFGKRLFELKLINKNEVNFNSDKLYADFDNVQLPLKINPIAPKDKFQPYGMRHNQLVSDILINKKINRFEKESIFMIKDSNSVALFLDIITSSNSFSLIKTTSNILQLTELN